jgi:hypothetical protein
MGKLLLVLLLGAVLVAGLGYHWGWFTVSTTRGTQRTDVQLTIDRAKVASDLQELRDRARNSSAADREDPAPPIRGQTVRGKVTKIEPEQNRFVVTTADNQAVTLHWDTATVLVVNGAKITQADLRAGDAVAVSYQVREGKNVATNVIIERK